jgi:hypothetical protein
LKLRYSEPPKEQSHDRPHLRNLQRAAQQHGRAHRALRHVLRQARWQHEVGADNDYGSKAMTDKAAAPWPDYQGNTIHHGDRLVHPDGNTFVAIKLEGYDDEGDAWRAIYDYDPSHLSRLNLQIGDRGRAALKAQPAPTEAQGDDSARLDTQVTAAARVLANRSADQCGVNRDDNWKVYGQDFIDDARAALEAARAAPQPQEQS